MRFSEFQNHLNLFKVTVRVKNDSGSMTVKTMVSADSLAQAQFMARHVFGRDAVLSIVRIPIGESMAEGTKTLSPQELQVKAMTDRAKQINQQAKMLKAQHSLKKAQAKIQKIYR